jgi:hypothetical protein
MNDQYPKIIKELAFRQTCFYSLILPRRGLSSALPHDEGHVMVLHSKRENNGCEAKANHGINVFSLKHFVYPLCFAEKSLSLRLI